MQACTHSAAGHPALFRAALHPAPLLVLPRDAVAIIQHFRGPLSAVRDLDGESCPGFVDTGLFVFEESTKPGQLQRPQFI